MLRKLYLLIILISFLFPGYSSSQEDSVETEEAWEDIEKDWNFHDDEWDWDSDWMDWEFHGRPTVEVNYGLPIMNVKSFNTDFRKNGAAEIRLGYSSLKDYDESISRYKSKYLFLSNFSKDLGKKENNSTKINSDIWRIGIGWQDGYGYQFGNSSIIPYTSNSFAWTRLKADYTILDPTSSVVLNNKALVSADEAKILDLFNDSFRFGTTTEGGIKIQPVQLISLNAGYERSIIFPRHLFWKHLGSMVIEWAGLSAVDYFVKEIMTESPAAGPVMNFLLKNALSFGMYQLRREKMNWPFNSAEPLTIDTFKFGVTFTF